MMSAVRTMQHCGSCFRRAANIKPMRYVRGASFRWTLQQITTALVARDFDLTASEYSLAHDTNALVVERIPFPQPIGLTQNLKALFGRKVSVRFHLLIEYE